MTKKIKKALATLMAACTVFSSVCIPTSVSATNTLTSSETESNNTIATASSISANRIKEGYISSTSDIDYYKFSPTVTGYYDITLSVPNNCNYNFAIYDYQGYLLTTVANYGAGIGELYNRYFISGNTYYIKVYSSSGYSSSAKYKLYLSSGVGLRKTWYSQIKSNIDGHEWNNKSLGSLYCGNKVFIDDDPNTRTDLMISGCAITSIAMVLHNMNAKTTQKITDYRTGYYGYMYADPFTVYMAHNNVTSISNPYTPSYSIDLRYYDDDNGVTHVSNIESYFGKTITVHSGNINDAKNELAAHPQGVIIRFPGHYVVMSPSNNSDGYVIYDPGTSNESTGNGVAFDNAYCHTSPSFGYNRSDVWQYILIE